MPRAKRPCSVPGCPQVARTGTSRCTTHTQQAERDRGTAAQRGYGYRHTKYFRPAVLQRDPICTCPPDHHAHQGRPCTHWSTVADHHPKSRRDLVALGLDPNDPKYGRGLCTPCHNHHTATTQQGGWNNSNTET